MGNPVSPRNMLREDQMGLVDPPGPSGPIGRVPEANAPRRKRKKGYQGRPQGLRETQTPTAPTPEVPIEAPPEVSTMPRMRFGGMLGAPTASLGMSTGLLPQMSTPMLGGMREGLGSIASPRFGGGSPMLNNIRNRFLSSTGLGGMNPYGRRSIY